MRTRSTAAPVSKKKARPEEDEPREDRQLCRERWELLLVHVCVAPTRQAVMMVQVEEGAGGGHVRKVLGTSTQVNGSARGMHRGACGGFGILGRQNCASGGL